ncbi:MAG: hypothetical protein N4A76_07555 [Firmicutes bacterium]|jgi:bacterioferritin (cytochrome b1)|nr:hypothetical protein [Bacillota bacterium]
MAYTVEDLVNKFIEIENKGDAYYKELSVNPNMDIKTRTIFKIFQAEEEKHADEYKNMLNLLGEEKNQEIDFLLYDKSQKILRNMNFNNYTFNELTSKDVLKNILFIEKEFLALALSVQGTIVKEEADKGSGAYRILTEIIEEEKNHISNIENFL